MILKPASIAGCVFIKPDVYKDARGVFVKTFQEKDCAEYGIKMHLAEQYFSKSRKGVIRGLHFQVPPHDQDKLVTAVDGKVFDVVVDLRVGSPSYGKHEAFTLDAEEGAVLFIPKGIAHGFQALTEMATLYYQVSTLYAPQHDGGIRWDSCGINWPLPPGEMSDRDRKFAGLAEYKSPFKF